MWCAPRKFYHITNGATSSKLVTLSDIENILNFFQKFHSQFENKKDGGKRVACHR
jgi:hypothetical protein